MSEVPEPTDDAAQIPASVAGALRDACVRILLDAYEDAGMRGLCGEGRWEVAVQELRRADPAAIARAVDERGASSQG